MAQYVDLPSLADLNENAAMQFVVYQLSSQSVVADELAKRQRAIDENQAYGVQRSHQDCAPSSWPEHKRSRDIEEHLNILEMYGVTDDRCYEAVMVRILHAQDREAELAARWERCQVARVMAEALDVHQTPGATHLEGRRFEVADRFSAIMSTIPSMFLTPWNGPRTDTRRRATARRR